MGLFSIPLVLKTAVDEEQRGADFYNSMAACASSKRVKAAAEALAAVELRHKDEFAAMLENAGGVDEAEGYAGEHEGYIAALLDRRAGPGGADAAKAACDLGSDADMVAQALIMERRTLLLYYELRDQMESRDRPRVEAVIDEEKEHVVTLTDLLVEMERG